MVFAISHSPISKTQLLRYTTGTDPNDELYPNSEDRPRLVLNLAGGHIQTSEFFVMSLTIEAAPFAPASVSTAFILPSRPSSSRQLSQSEPSYGQGISFLAPPLHRVSGRRRTKSLRTCARAARQAACVTRSITLLQFNLLSSERERGSVAYSSWRQLQHRPLLKYRHIFSFFEPCMSCKPSYLVG
jgi:hypothetical protein